MSDAIHWEALTLGQRDELVHEKVMGHRYSMVEHEAPSRAGGIAFTYSVKTWQTGGQEIPHYTRSLDAAWFLIEYLRKQRFDVHLAVDPLEYDVMILDRRLGGRSFEAITESASEAICIAALRAVGITVITD